ncbi:MAG: hypothetical protein P8Y58_15835 [Novosphingobium sp.]
MKVAEKNVIQFDHRSGGPVEMDQGKVARMVYASQRSQDQELEHDARGLIVAILLCMACWAALGYFLLS